MVRHWVQSCTVYAAYCVTKNTLRSSLVLLSMCCRVTCALCCLLGSQMLCGGCCAVLGGQEQAFSAVSHTDMLGMDVERLLPGAWFVVHCASGAVPLDPFALHLQASPSTPRLW